MKRGFALLLVTMLVLTAAVTPAAANSAQTHWTGVDATGAVVQDAHCPIVVEAERLIFDIRQFPEIYGRELEAFLSYSGSVTAEYTFYNPADYAVTATLLFPFGCAPSYAPDDCYGRDAEKYDILVDGAAIDRTLRHTLSDRYARFDLDRDLALLHDDYVTDDFLTPDLPVTKYVFVPEGVDTETYDAATVGFEMVQDDPVRKLLFVNQSGMHTMEHGVLWVDTWVATQETVTVYVLGQDYDAFPQWAFYRNGGFNDRESIAGTMREESRQTMTFRELAMSEWDADTGVSEIDWYNAVAAMLTDETCATGSLLNLWDFGSLDLRDNLMRWYEYELTLEPGARIVNTVTAPIYPDIVERYDPPVYSYCYLLSPAQTWADFGTLDILVNTPFYMTVSGPEGFERTGTGYALHLDGLPEGELNFDLCSEPDPALSSRYGLGGWTGVTAVLAALIGVILLVMPLRNRKKQS